MKTLKYQQEAVVELTDKIVKAINAPELRRNVLFEAPTGAGKTVMACQTLASIVDALKNRGDCRFQECAFIWIAPRQLHIQSYLSIKEIFSGTRKLTPIKFDEIDQNEGIQSGEILFVNWESINKDSNKAANGGENTKSIFEIARITQEEMRLPIVAIIDEEHMFWAKTADKSKLVLDRINPKVEFRISATLKTLAVGATQKVVIDRNDVIAAEMIKKEIVLNPDIDVDTPAQLSIEERLLKSALACRQRLADEYLRLGININPLLLIQLPNDTKETMSDDDNKVAEIVKKYLRYNNIEEITPENGKLAVWLSGEKENLAGLERYDNMTKVLLFKEAIALGWDCPRAAVLLIFRNLKSNVFTVQTVGRIMRMPEQKHYTSEILNVGYVYTNIAKHQIEIIATDQSYILKNTYTATRRSNLVNVSLTATYATRPNSLHNYLGPDFRPVLFEQAKKLWGLKYDDYGDVDITENRRRAEEYLRLDVRTVNVAIPKDVHFQNEAGIINVDQAQFARTDAELDRVFKAYINTKGGIFEYRQGDRTARIANYLLDLLDQCLNLQDVAAKKVVLYHENRPKFDRLLDLAFEEYQKKRQSRRPNSKRLLTEFDWEVPEQRIYDADTHEIKTEPKNHALDPFVRKNDQSSPEDKFIEYLERYPDKIDWWYKNGDKGKMHYAIPYDVAGENDPLFYPDFIIRMKSGRIYIFDTKTEGSDIDAPSKHNALLKYARNQRDNGTDIYGGIIIQPQGKEYWLYSKIPIDNTTDLTNWTLFDLAKI